jgi:hypothetical protein
VITLEEIVNNPPAYLGTGPFFDALLEALDARETVWRIPDLGRFLNRQSYGHMPYVNRGIELLFKSIVIALIKRIREDGAFETVFPDGSIILDEDRGELYLNQAHRPARYAPVWNLIDSLVVPQDEITAADVTRIPLKGIESHFAHTLEDRAMTSLEDLKHKLMAQEEAGRAAELFVVAYEESRLSGHENKSQITMISDYNVGAGYDIVSFEALSSDHLDRFIEVKSYTGDPARFYWTSNEIRTAQLKGESYYLYLVDRKRMINPGYVPHVIKNPYRSVLLSDEWITEATVSHVYYNGAELELDTSHEHTDNMQ